MRSDVFAVRVVLVASGRPQKTSPNKFVNVLLQCLRMILERWQGTGTCHAGGEGGGIHSAGLQSENAQIISHAGTKHQFFLTF